MKTLTDVRKAPNNRTMGIEIECFVQAECFIALFAKHFNFFYCGDDGSLRNRPWNHYGVEFVSQPLTVPWLHRQLKIFMKKQVGPIQHNSSCGVHVHVSKKWLSEKKAKAIYLFIQHAEVDDLYSLFGRYPNDYCRRNHDFKKSRYNAINAEPEHTYEFRSFASHDQEWWFHWCIDFTNYLVDHAHHLNIDAMMAFKDWWNQSEMPKYQVR